MHMQAKLRGKACEKKYMKSNAYAGKVFESKYMQKKLKGKACEKKYMQSKHLRQLYAVKYICSKS